MKKYLILNFVLIFFFINQIGFSQRIGNLKGINYQAVAIDEYGKEIVGMDVNGKPLYNKQISVRFSIHKGLNGTLLYQESHTVQTDRHGLFSLTIGLGKYIAGQYTKLLDIPWIDADQFLKVEISTKNDGIYRIVSNQQFMSVPYSYYTDDIADDAITTEKILNEQVQAVDIDTSAVTTSEILNLTILNEDIANGTIDLTTKVTGILPVKNGGTGVDASTVTNGQILIGDGANKNFKLATITAGTGINITNTAGGITIASPPIAIGSDGTFTVPVGSNGNINSGQAWKSPNSLKIPAVPGKPFAMGDIFLVSANIDLQGCILSAYLQNINGDGTANLQIIIFNPPNNQNVTLQTPATFKFLLVK